MGILLVCCDDEWFNDMLPTSLLTILIYSVVVRCSRYRNTSDGRPELEVAMRVYHNLACLLPDDFGLTYMMVLHVTDNPALLHTNPQDGRTIHDLINSIKDTHEGQNGSSLCSLLSLSTEMVSRWRSDAFINEKLVKNILVIHETDSLCVIKNIAYRWYYNTIAVGRVRMPIIHRRYGRLDSTSFKQILNHGVHLELPMWHLITQEWIDEKISLLREFMHSIIVHSITIDAIANAANNSLRPSKWIRFGEKEFRRSGDSVDFLKRWGAVLNGARMTFVILGGFALFIMICTMCACTCLLSADLEEEYINRREMRQRMVDQRAAEEAILLRQQELVDRENEPNGQEPQNARSTQWLENVDGTVTARSGQLASVSSTTQLSSCSDTQTDETFNTAISVEDDRSTSDDLITANNVDGDLRIIYKCNK
uniref:Uncharacterized protein n=1 Tax=Parascaris univalens TaxID=6257 RepID=A0A915C8F6_PARUN